MEKSNEGFKNGLLGGVLGSLAVLAIAAVALLVSPFGEQLTKQNDAISVSAGLNESAVDVADVVEQVDPAVVSIVIKKDVPIVEQYFTNPFGSFFGMNLQVPEYRQNGSEEKQVGAGSGFLISSDGYIATNAHVVNIDGGKFSVFLTDGTEYDAEVVSYDEVLDLAVIKIDGHDLPYLQFGDSDSLRLGQGVIVIGNALGEFGNSISTGVISGLSRTILASNGTGSPEQLENVIQTDAAINPGNSGGPMLDFAGNVVGISVAVASGSENIGFAIPANTASEAITVLKDGKKIARPFLGVRYKMTDAGAEVVSGATGVDAVYPDSPADKAGIVEGDVIEEIDGETLNADNDLAKIIRSKSVGDKVKVRYMRDGEEKIVTVTLEELPSQ